VLRLIPLPVPSSGCINRRDCVTTPLLLRWQPYIANIPCLVFLLPQMSACTLTSNIIRAVSVVSMSKGLSLVKCWLTIVTALLISSSLSAAERVVDFSFVTHHEAQNIYAKEERLQDYRLALGTYKKRRSQWLPEDSRHLTGKLKSQTLEFSKSHNAAEIFEFYRRQLLPQQTSTLFSCEARGCGSSNVWANNHFKIYQLYGLDQFQFYGVYQWQLKPDGPIHYITLYTVKRGNDRVYAQTDVFLPDEPTASPRLNQ
jgi:Domain of unknown function (DUF4892)